MCRLCGKGKALSFWTVLTPTYTQTAFYDLSTKVTEDTFHMKIKRSANYSKSYVNQDLCTIFKFPITFLLSSHSLT